MLLYIIIAYLHKKYVDFYVPFLRKVHINEQTPFTRVFLSGTQPTAESTEAMLVKCLAQVHNILMQLGFEPSIAANRNRRLTNMTNMLIAANCLI